MECHQLMLAAYTIFMIRNVSVGSEFWPRKNVGGSQAGAQTLRLSPCFCTALSAQGRRADMRRRSYLGLVLKMANKARSFFELKRIGFSRTFPRGEFLSFLLDLARFERL